VRRRAIAPRRGRPLGYLFLDKLFQLRVPVPSIDARRQHEYLSELLRVRGSEEVAQIIAAEERWVRDRLRRSSTASEVVEALRSASPVVRTRVAAAAVQKLSAPEVEAATEHTLLRFAPLLTGNPRSMKRFVNDYSVLCAVRTLEGNPVQSEPVALWAILETQWPALADYLRGNPNTISQIGDSPADLDLVPAAIRSLFDDPDVRRLAAFEYGGSLTAELIRSCCGAPSPPNIE
jgi:KAP family P-loop domain